MKKFMLWFSGIAITVVTGIMDFVFFPRIERDTEGIKAFDMNSFGYKYEQAQKFLDLIDDVQIIDRTAVGNGIGIPIQIGTGKRVGSLPDCRSMKMFFRLTPASCIAKSCLASF